MTLWFRLFAHLLVTLARLARPGGVRAVAAESLAVKYQLLIMKRSKRRSPNLTSWDRVILGFCTLLVSPRRLGKIDAVVEMKRRNPYFGCRKIAEQISNAFGIELNKDVVRRILIRDYRPGPDGGRPSWLSVIGQARDRLWSVDLFRTESILLKSYWVMVVMDVYTRRIVGFGVAAANLDGRQVCRMFNHAIARQTLPRHLSSDHDPLFRFHRWRANLRVLEVDEIKTIPATPRSHAFVERLIGTIRREYLDRICFWNQSDLERKLEDYKVFYNQYRCHTGLTGATPAQRSGAPALPHACFDSYRWQQHCYGLFKTPAAA